jgi:hypothetical protein
MPATCAAARSSAHDFHVQLLRERPAGTFVEDGSTYSDFGGATTGRWVVTAATYDATSARATVRRDNADGTTGWVEFAATPGQITVNGSAVSVATSGVCA